MIANDAIQSLSSAYKRACVAFEVLIYACNAWVRHSQQCTGCSRCNDINMRYRQADTDYNSSVREMLG